MEETKTRNKLVVVSVSQADAGHTERYRASILITALSIDIIVKNGYKHVLSVPV